MLEIWKEIEHYPNYEISSFGNVRRSDTLENKALTLGSGGYKKVSLYKNGKSKTFVAHRLVAIAFIPNNDNKELVNHIDFNKANNNVTNLEWVTHSENSQHYSDANRDKLYTGLNNPASKLTLDDIIAIRNDMSSHFTDIALKFNITAGTVRNIKRGVTYSDLPGPIITPRTEGAYKGMKVAKPKISEEIARKIKYENLNMSISAVGRLHKVSRDIVGRIRKNITWKHV